MMPGMDGWAVLKELKADPALSEIPVMMITIVGDKDIGYSLGAVEYLTKPVDRDKLRQLVKQYARPRAAATRWWSMTTRPSARSSGAHWRATAGRSSRPRTAPSPSSGSRRSGPI